MFFGIYLAHRGNFCIGLRYGSIEERDEARRDEYPLGIRRARSPPASREGRP
jgi:hypothetical protein